jgi:fumarylacetoacetate (FAA) hydrolase
MMPLQRWLHLCLFNWNCDTSTMKLATLKDGTRDGQLIVVSRDLHTAVIADAIAPTMQRVIEDWPFYAPQLQTVYESLNGGRMRRAFGFEAKDCMAPLPRAYRLALQCNDQSASRTMLSDALLAARDEIVVPGAEAVVDFFSGLGLLLSDVKAGIAPGRAAESIRLVMLGAAMHGQDNRAQDHSASNRTHAWWYAFSPVAVTPDEFGQQWQDAHLNGALAVQINGRRASAASTEALREIDMGLLVAALAQWRDVTAGTLLLSAPAAHTQPESLVFGDRIRVDIPDSQGGSICGAIELSISPVDE